jgi:hypothetical protein
MPTLEALKEIFYGRVTYQPGDKFESSEKDAKVLAAVGKAKAVEAPKPAAAPEEVQPPQEPQPQAEQKEAEPAPLAEPAPAPMTYRRRDMQAEDGQTGEAKSPPLSRRGRQQKARKSKG